MHYVYLIESTAASDQRYVGLTTNLKRRLLKITTPANPAIRRNFAHGVS